MKEEYYNDYVFSDDDEQVENESCFYASGLKKKDEIKLGEYDPLT